MEFIYLVRKIDGKIVHAIITVPNAELELTLAKRNYARTSEEEAIGYFVEAGAVVTLDGGESEDAPAEETVEKKDATPEDEAALPEGVPVVKEEDELIPEVFTCADCGKEYKTEKGLASHAEKEHEKVVS